MALAVQDGTLSLQAELEPLRNLERTYRTTSMDETGQRRRGRKAPCSAGLRIRHGRLDEVLLGCGMKWLALACGQSAGVQKIGRRRNLETTWSARTWQAGIVKIHARRRDFKVVSSDFMKY